MATADLSEYLRDEIDLMARSFRGDVDPSPDKFPRTARIIALALTCLKLTGSKRSLDGVAWCLRRWVPPLRHRPSDESVARVFDAVQACLGGLYARVVYGRVSVSLDDIPAAVIDEMVVDVRKGIMRQFLRR